MSELEQAVIQDVTFTHSHIAMGHLCTAYSLMIATLIKNVESQERASIAMEVVRQYASMAHVDELVGEFLQVA